MAPQVPNRPARRIRDKILTVISKRPFGEVLSRGEIISMVEKAYPGTNPTSIIPSDYCYNILNRGIKFDFYLFEHLGHGHYKVLGTGFDYAGPIYWKDKKVGEWRKGENRPRIFENVTLTRSF
jgi:hypothetical protein